MIESEEINVKQLKDIALLLGREWRYNEVVTKNTEGYSHYLSHNDGLLIRVYTGYQKKITQWAICYPHPLTKNYQDVISIGCSLLKSNKTIVADLKIRLLSETGHVFKEWQKLIDKLGEKHNAEALDQYMIESMQRVLDLSPCPDHRYCHSYNINNKCGKEVATVKKMKGKGDDFKLIIGNLKAEHVIKIMQLLNMTK